MADWRLKAAVQGVLARVPGGRAANYRLQRLTGGLPISHADLTAASMTAAQHVDVVREHLDVDLAEASFFEFGAGWDMHVPVALYTLGVDRQTVVDLHPLVREDLVRDVCDRLVAVLPGAVREPIRDSRLDLDGLLRAMGIDYCAPADARVTGLRDGSIDAVTSTNTLEHIPPGDILRILREMRRILRPGGILSASIDYQDHYSYFDPDITVYNFLQYTERRWRWFNNDLHHQNRLRHQDHLRLISDAGFEIIAVEAREPDAADHDVLDRLSLAEPFASSPRNDIGVRGALITATPA